MVTGGTPGLADGLVARNVRTLRTAKGTQVSYIRPPAVLLRLRADRPARHATAASPERHRTITAKAINKANTRAAATSIRTGRGTSPNQ